MIKVHCRTNLDLEPGEQWPAHLPEVPRVGDLIESSLRWGKLQIKLRLRVCSVTWKCIASSTRYPEWCPEVDEWCPEIELHLPSHFRSIKDFYDWYGEVTGKGSSAYI